MLPGTCLQEEFAVGTLRQPGGPGLLACARPGARRGSKHHLVMGPRKPVVFSCPPQRGAPRGPGGPGARAITPQTTLSPVRERWALGPSCHRVWAEDALFSASPQPMTARSWATPLPSGKESSALPTPICFCFQTTQTDTSSPSFRERLDFSHFLTSSACSLSTKAAEGSWGRKSKSQLY